MHLSLDPPVPSVDSPPPQAIPSVYYGGDSVEAYRLYYKQEKRHLFCVETRGMPEFLKFPFLDEIRHRGPDHDPLSWKRSPLGNANGRRET